MTDIKNFSFRRAATIKVPEEFFNPLKTGMKDVDDAWSELGGIVPSQVTFITGQPGSGKTTLTLAIGACLSRHKPVAFISLEMSDFQLAHQARKIPGFGGVDVTGDFDQEMTMEALRELKPGLIILDSIQKAARKMRDENGKMMPFDRAQFTIVDMFTKYAKETWTPIFLIGHCDKSGNYKGPSELLHDVDSHLLVNYDKEMDLRTFTFGKNRFGGMVQESLFGITRDSVWVGSPYITTVFGDAAITPTRPEEPPQLVAQDGRVSSCISSLTTNWNGSTARATITAVIDFLKAHDPDFRNDSIVGDPNRVKVQFRGNSLAHCHPGSGELVFGKKTFTKMTLGNVGYAKEQKHINSRCTTNGDLLVWVIVHEWCHLFKDMQKHNNEFFDFVATKYDWMKNEIAILNK
jgi:RecA/RadA recombinase